MRILCFALLSTFITLQTASAKGNTFVFEHYSQENGLSNNQVQYIFQDQSRFYVVWHQSGIQPV
jgi:hypothetical protein